MDLFKPDIFSQTIPKWIKATSYLESELEPIISKMFNACDLKKVNIEFSGSMEINSSNFRVSFLKKKYIIKKWPINQTHKSILNINKTVLFLENNQISVPKIMPLFKNEMILKSNNHLWTCSEFIGGEYFSGKNNQLESAALLTANTTNKLFFLPKDISPKRKIRIDLSEMLQLINKTEFSSSNWEKTFGLELSCLLNSNISKLKYLCKDFKSKKINCGQVFPNHYDMHPHNILFDNNDSPHLLDFESIVEIPTGNSIAYSTLKQCRQSISLNQNESPSEVSKLYIDLLAANLKIGKLDWIDNFKELAQIETLRRISIVLKLNIEGNCSWNKVLPVLFSNLYEAEELFN